MVDWSLLDASRLRPARFISASVNACSASSRRISNRKRLGEVFDAPLDVILSKRDVVEPDLIVVADQAQVSHRAVEGAPLLLVEVLSPGSIEHDRIVKAARYAALGVPHYWIVDLDARAIERSRRVDVSYELVVRAQVPAALRHPDWPDMTIDTAAIWHRT